MAFLPLPHQNWSRDSLRVPLWVTCGSVMWWGNGRPANFGRQSANLGEGGMAWVAILLPPPHTGNCSFLPLSPSLHDFCLIFLMLFSPLDTALLFDVNTAIMGWLFLAVKL